MRLEQSLRRSTIFHPFKRKAKANTVSTMLKKTRISAYGLVVRQRKILLCRVSAELPKWQGQWTLPGGGIDFGEAPEDAMVREVEEETGILVSPRSIATVDSLHDKSSEPEFHGIRIIYNTEITGGTLRNEISGTTDKASWFTEDNLSKHTLVDIARLGAEIIFGEKFCRT